MYKLIKDNMEDIIRSVIRLTDMGCIPFATDNTDYQQFKLDIQSGVELQDPDGVKMTKAKVTAFLKTLP
jgi:hypothetical protein